MAIITLKYHVAGDISHLRLQEHSIVTSSDSGESVVDGLEMKNSVLMQLRPQGGTQDTRERKNVQCVVGQMEGAA